MKSGNNTHRFHVDAAVVSGNPEAKSGDFFGPDGMMQMRGFPVQVEPTALAEDPELARRLWEISVERTGVDFGKGE